MASTSIEKPGRIDKLGIWVSAILTWLKIWLDRRWPESLSAVMVSYAFTGWFLLWFGSKVWTGYRRRRPHWTGESWRRYLRLAAMPVAAIVLFLALVYLNDVRPGVFGAPRSVARELSAVIDLTLMLSGVVGIVMAIGWLEEGEPSQQFTRTRWFRRRGRSAIAD